MEERWMLKGLAQSSELGKGFYTLSSLDGKKIVTTRINGAHLKVYKRSSSQGQLHPPPHPNPQSSHQSHCYPSHHL